MKRRNILVVTTLVALLAALSHFVPVKQKTGPGTYGFQATNDIRYSILKGETSAYNESTNCDLISSCDSSQHPITHRLYLW